VPQVLLEIEKRGVPPVQPLAKPGRCSNVLRGLPEEKAREVLEAASRFRLGRKAARLARLAEIHGLDEALYQALAVTLGYKTNQLPFALLAQRLPLALLLKNREDAGALLFGVAGFIDFTDFSQFDSETRSYLRNLWESWWTRRIEFQRIGLLKSEWRFSGVRPANDPHRRVAALLEMTRHWAQLRKLAKSCKVGPLRKFFATLGMPNHLGPEGELSSGSGADFWRFHYSFHSPRLQRGMALVGDSRVSEMLANVFFPFAILSDPDLWSSYSELPATLSNRRAETAAVRLFGRDGRGPVFLRKVMYQQGLLQIYEDFCSYDASDCIRCPFPEQCVNLPWMQPELRPGSLGNSPTPGSGGPGSGLV